MSARAFGASALGDADFVASLGRGRIPRLATVDRVLAFIGEAPVGSAFRAEVEAFLKVTGIKRSMLGSMATGNRSFVAHLRQGMSPTLATAGNVWAWMDAHASAAELRKIRGRSGAAPAILAGIPMIERSLHRELLARSEANDLGKKRPVGPRDGRAYVNTIEAAGRLGLSPRTLDRYRTIGAGPAFHRFGKVVRYRCEDLETWAAGRRRAAPGVRAGVS